MDAVSYTHSAKQEQRIKRFIENPDSNSGVLTQPKVIEAGETVTIKSGRQAILADTVIDGDLVIEAGGEVFIPAGAGFSDLDQRIDNIQTLPIGAILNGYTIFDNCIVAFGGEFNRADYPKLWAYLQANPSLLKTQTQWQTEATANGGICGFFSDGNGTTTFRVPNLDKAFLRPDSRGVTSYQSDEFKSHNHYWYFDGQANPIGSGNTASTGNNPNAQTAKGVPTTYIGGSETRPKNIAVLPLIVAK